MIKCLEAYRLKTERAFLVKKELYLVQTLLTRYHSVNMGVVETSVGCTIGVSIRAVLSIKLPLSSFLEQAMQGNLFDLIHFAAQGCLCIDLQMHIYIYIYIYIYIGRLTQKVKLRNCNY